MAAKNTHIKALLSGVAIAIMATSLISCGGGSSSSGGTSVAPPPPPPPPVNQAPIANAGVDLDVELSTNSIKLDGSRSSDPDGDNLTFSWVITSQPTGSTVSISNSDTSMANFISDVAGEYIFTLTVTDPSQATDSDTITVSVTEAAPSNKMTVTLLDSEFTDAEFSKANETLIYIHDAELTVITPQNDIRTLTLPHAANAVSISPSGTRAAVAHDRHISFIDVVNNTLEATYFYPVEPGYFGAQVFHDIVLDDNGFAHTFLDVSNFIEVITFDGRDGTVSKNTGDPVLGTSKGRLHPSGRSLYVMSTDRNNGVYPPERLSINGSSLNNSLRDGDEFAMFAGTFRDLCFDMWFSPDGESFLTQCHNVLRASDNPDSDRAFIMQLGPDNTAIEHATSSGFDNVWYVIDRNGFDFSGNEGSNVIDVYDTHTGATLSPIELPSVSNGASADWKAKFVFSSDDSDLLRILAVDDLKNPQNFAMITRGGAAASSANKPPTAHVQRYLTAYASEDFSIDASESIDPEGNNLTYSWAIKSQPQDSNLTTGDISGSEPQLNLTVSGIYELSLRVSDGEKMSAMENISISIVENDANFIRRLKDDITDAEFSKPLNSLIYISPDEKEVVILDLSTFQEKRVLLAEQGYRIGVSQDGHYAAVSQEKSFSLTDLRTATVVDTQEAVLSYEPSAFGESWGDIVLDSNNIAHFVQNNVLTNNLFSINFAQDLEVAGARSFLANLRMHPTEDWIYAAWRGISPGNVAKFDTSSFPVSKLAESRFSNSENIGFNLWLSETGDKILIRNGLVFSTNQDPSLDMEIENRVSETLDLTWADHSSEQGQWAGSQYSSTADIFPGDEIPQDKLFFINDTNFAVGKTLNVPDITAINGSFRAGAPYIFHSSNGEKIYVVLRSDDLVDNFAILVLDAD